MGSLQHAGQLLRETLVGFTELARTRADFASEFGISSFRKSPLGCGASYQIAIRV
jgi:hypothetical protein